MEGPLRGRFAISLRAQGCAPRVDLATPPRKQEVAAPAAASEEASSSGADPASVAASSSVQAVP
eukprot:12847304-Alexandrium_andersonii.AAC.1